MATEEVIITVYTLTVTAARGTDENPQDLVVKTNSTNSDYQIKSLSYEKRLYSPCCINMELSRLENTLTQKDIKKDFTGKTVSLLLERVTESGQVKAKAEISNNYYVYQCNPVFADSKCSVFLTLYSRDKLLTLDKFNKVYLNKKLGDGIIREMLGTVNGTKGSLEKCNVKFDLKSDGNFDENRLQLLSYSITTGKGTNDEKTTSHEVIQPYRVQYNEDFYSFISRVACRCGEFLYFEDGKLKLGLDNSTSITINSSDIISEEYPGFGNSSLKITGCSRNYLSAYTDGNIWSTASLPCSDYGAFDEYFDTLDKNNLPDSYGSEFYGPDIANLVKDTVIPAAGRGLWGGEVYTTTQKLIRLGLDFTTLMASYQNKVKSVNDKFTEFFGTTDTQHTNGTSLSQFADARKDGYGKLLNIQLQEIRDKEIKAAQSIVRIGVKSSFTAYNGIKLGSSVNFNGGNYRVVSCTGQYFKKDILVGINKNNGRLRYDKELTDTTVLDLVPAQTINLYVTSDDKKPSTGTLFIPPYNKCAESVPASPQIAIVTADNDPRYLGRVRVRYTWQNWTEAGSPWVRVLSPLASKSGAVHFQPKKDDEVLLGYIDGNIDRPYVAGSLFNKKDEIHDSLFSAYNDTIRVGSQRLDFRSGSIQNWLESVVPFAGAVTSFMPGKMAEMTKNYDNTSSWANDLHGITRLTDKWSIWTIEGNTGSRSVTIKSAWGKVKINAYTGIEIESAGDISIKGNNISIKAQNNIHIESGIAIKNARKSKTEYENGGPKARGFAQAVKDIATAKLDLSLIRTIWESFAPPKEGTLKIKSNRYLALEAGEGEAFDNEIVNNQQGMENNRLHRFAYKEGLLLSITENINRIHDAVASYYQIYDAKKNGLTHTKTEYTSLVNEMKKLESFGNLQDWDDFLLSAQGSDYNKAALADYNTIVNVEYNIPLNPNEYHYACAWRNHMDNWLPILKTAHSNVPQILQGTLSDYNNDIKNVYFGENNVLKEEVDLPIIAFRKVVKKYLTNIHGDEGLTLPNNLDENYQDAHWNAFVNDININATHKESKSELLGKYLLKAYNFASDAEYERIYDDSDAKNITKGRILMSQKKEESMHINGKTIEVTTNNTLKSVKEALRRNF